MSLGTQLVQAPSDGITRVQFVPHDSKLLLVAGWDKAMRLYDVDNNTCLATHSTAAPLLDVAWGDHGSMVAYSGAVDGGVRRHDLETGAATVLGQHEKAVKAIVYLADHNLLVSGSWDSTLRLFDPRAAPPSACVGRIDVPGKVFAAAAAQSTIVVSTSNRRVLVFDATTIHKGLAVMDVESPLKYQTRCVACFPSAQGVAMGSVEGRLAIEPLGSASSIRKFAFKCHRTTQDTKQVVYPVNAVAFHPTYGTFATGGSDGVVAVWDAEHQKRLAQWSGYPSSIASLAFSHDGCKLAVASSYLYEQGASGAGTAGDEVYVRAIADADVKPRAKGAKH